MITKKEQIIEYFKSGIKNKKNLKLVSNMRNFYLIVKIIRELIIKK